MEALEIWRIFSLEDGTSSMERIDIPMSNGRSEILQNAVVQLARMSKDLSTGWHPARKRELFVTIAGEGEIETGDGQVLVLRPGVITLSEDVSGLGHVTRGRGDVDRVSVTIAIDDSVLQNYGVWSDTKKR